MLQASRTSSIMSRVVLSAFCLWLLIGWCVQNARAAVVPDTGSKHALVIGNGAYTIDPLKNPPLDARLMSETLTSLGFKVTRTTDLDRQGMIDALDTFTRTLPKNGIALVYFAGHGMQIEGTNYLIPTRMVPSSPAKVTMHAFPVNRMIEGLASSASAVNILVLDACRNNPFLPQSTSRTRSYDGLGLARIAQPRGMFIAYATAPGQLADDGMEQANGLYTTSLARWLKKPHLTIEQIFKGAADEVRKATLEDQQPWFESSLVDDFYFLPPNHIQVQPKNATTGQGDTTKNPRGTPRSTQADNPPWFMSLQTSEWDKLDFDVSQRARHLTADEIPLLEHRAKSDNVVAMTTLGLAYFEGIDKASDARGQVVRSGANNTLALQWLRAAAKHEFPMAQVLLGEMYYDGRGVDRDLQKARFWFEQAARVNYQRAKLDLLDVKIQSGDGREGQVEIMNMMMQARDMFKVP